MSIANVSEIVGRRDLVAEAQGWSDIMLKKKALEMKSEQAKEARKPKPYNFELAEFGTKNENMFAVQQDLNEQAYNFAMANSDLLRMDPYSEDCGPNCKQAHKTLYNMQAAAQIFNQYGNDLKSRYDNLANLMSTDRDNYWNAENSQTLMDMKNVWEQGMNGENYNFTFGPDGKLMVETRNRKQTKKIATDESGEAIFKEDGVTPKHVYYDENNEETDDVSKARKDENGNPVFVMEDMNTGQDTDFDISFKNFGDWLTDLGFNNAIKNANNSNFQDTNVDYAKLLKTNKLTGEYLEDMSKQALEAYIFGGGGEWDDESGEGTTMGHSSYLSKLVKADKQAKGDLSPVTKIDIINKAYELGIGTLETSQKKQDTQDQMELYNLNIPGVVYKNTVEYDIEGNVIQVPKREDSEPVNYPFEGKGLATGGSGQNYISFNHTINPNNTTIISGDNNFQTVNSTTALDAYEKPREFRTGTIGIAPFYVDPDTGRGRAISQKDLTNLTLEEKKNIQYKVALYGDIVFTRNESGKLGNLGIDFTDTDDGLLVPAIIDAGFHENRIKDVRSSTDPDKASSNRILYDQIAKQAAAEQEAWKAELEGELKGDQQNNQNQQNNNQDPLGIL